MQSRNDKTEVISETQRETRLAGDKEEGSAERGERTCGSVVVLVHDFVHQHASENLEE